MYFRKNTVENRTGSFIIDLVFGRHLAASILSLRALSLCFFILASGGAKCLRSKVAICAQVSCCERRAAAVLVSNLLAKVVDRSLCF